MRYINANLQGSISSGVYDKTKTSVFGREQQRTLSGVNVIGPPQTQFVDTFTDAALTPGLNPYVSPNGRMFIPTVISAGVITIALYNFNLTTGAKSYVGKITANFPNTAATTHTLRFIRVYDGANSGVVTGWRIVVGTIGSVLINGGVFLINNVALSDFVPISPPVFGMAVASNAKSVYQLQDPAAMGVSANITALMGGGLNRATQELIITNGTAASMTTHGFDLTAAATISLQTCTGATVNGSPTFTLTAHGYSANDPVVITANAPTAFTISTSTTQTVYFVRNPAANTFELSATSGGASINATSVATPTVGRAFGQTSALYEAARKSGTIATGFLGTFLAFDCQEIDTINDASSPNNGFVCYVMGTNTNFYHFKISDITAGATNLPSAFGVNALGNGIDVVTPTPTFMAYSTAIGKIIYSVSAFSFMAKNWVNSQITNYFGGQLNSWLENSLQTTQYFRAQAILGIAEESGWLFVASSTAGQRGVLCLDMESDNSFDYSYAISPILDTQTLSSQMAFVTTLEEAFNITDTTEVYYRSAASSSDAMFNLASGSWTLINENEDLSSIALQRYVQLKIGHDVLSLLSGTPSQIADIVLGYNPVTDLSMHWEGSVDNSSLSSSSPMYVAFRMTTNYSSGTVPKLYIRGIDDSGSIVYNFNTVSDSSVITYSTNNGTSWNALGTIPNTALTTEIRLQVTSPSGTRITWTINES